MSATLEATGEFVDLQLSDWEGARTAHLSRVPRSSTVGQLVGEAVQALGLPLGGFFRAVLRGVELDPSETVDDLGIETDARIELVPEVSAG